jgi:hypothetical protein
MARRASEDVFRVSSHFVIRSQRSGTDRDYTGYRVRYGGASLKDSLQATPVRPTSRDVMRGWAACPTLSSETRGLYDPGKDTGGLSFETDELLQERVELRVRLRRCRALVSGVPCTSYATAEKVLVHARRQRPDKLVGKLAPDAMYPRPHDPIRGGDEIGGQAF